MAKQFVVIDEQGFEINVVLLDTHDSEGKPREIPPNYVPGNTAPLFVPRWDRETDTWVEGATEEYIDQATTVSDDQPTEMELLKQENTLLKAQMQANSDRSDFHEELIAEMAMLVYP
jgi:hypothetical protein